MNLFARVPAPIAWVMRIVCWAIGLAIIAAILMGYGSLRLSQQIGECLQVTPHRAGATALASTQQLLACVDKTAGPLERVLLWRSRRAVAALPNAPCRYVGVWSATRPETEYRITLKDDGQFVAQPVKSPDPEVITGSWGIHKDSIVWLYDNGLVWPPDINGIKHAGDDSFTLTERDRSRTRYALLERIESKQCPKPLQAQAAPSAPAAPVPQGAPKMRPPEGLSQAQRSDYEQLHLAYIETFRIAGRAKACNHLDAEARMQSLLKEMEQRHGNDNILMTALLGFIAGAENRAINAKEGELPPPPVPCDVIAGQMSALQLPPIPASLLLQPGQPVDRIRQQGSASTGAYQLVTRSPGEKGVAEHLVMHREKVAFRTTKEFAQERLVDTPTPVLLVSTQDQARKCADGKPHFTWHAVSLPSWGDSIVSPLEDADCMVVWPYTDANGRIGLCAWINTGADRRPSRLFRIEDHGQVIFSEERRVGACPR